MAANQNDTGKFRILKTVLVGSKVISNAIIKCISNSVNVKEEETVFAEEVGTPETDSTADTGDKTAAQPETESKVDDAVKTETSYENAAQPQTESKDDAAYSSNANAAQPVTESEAEAQPQTENKVDNAAQPATASEAEAQPQTENTADNAAQPATEKPKEVAQVKTENKDQKPRKRKLTAEGAAIKIQSLERQRQSKKTVQEMLDKMEEQEMERDRAAILIQNAQRRKSAMKKYKSMQSETDGANMDLSVTEVTHALHDLLALGDPEELHANKTFANLITAKANIDMESEDGYTAIALACYYQGEDVVSKLIELNANLNATGPQGDTLLIAATTRTPCEPEIITLLLDYPEIRANINVCEHNYQTSALFLLCQEYDSTHANHTRCENALKRMLVVRDIDVDITNSAGVTPLMMAVSNGSHNVAQILMDYGADPNKKDNRGNSALAIAGVGEDDLMWQILGGEFED